MSRRGSSLQQLHDNADQILLDAGDKSPDRTCQSSILGQLRSWFDDQLGPALFDDKLPESYKILPSLVSFTLGLLLVKIYGDSLDSAITRCYGHLTNALSASYGLFVKLTSKEIEIFTVLCLVLLWIGALRILFNLARRLVQVPRNTS